MPTMAMTHIAVQESLNGKNVDWLEKVSDEQIPSPGDRQQQRSRLSRSPIERLAIASLVAFPAIFLSGDRTTPK